MGLSVYLLYVPYSRHCEHHHHHHHHPSNPSQGPDSRAYAPRIFDVATAARRLCCALPNSLISFSVELVVLLVVGLRYSRNTRNRSDGLSFTINITQYTYNIYMIPIISKQTQSTLHIHTHTTHPIRLLISVNLPTEHAQPNHDP